MLTLLKEKWFVALWLNGSFALSGRSHLIMLMCLCWSESACLHFMNQTTCKTKANSAILFNLNVEYDATNKREWSAKKHPNVNFCGFCDLEFMIAHFVNRIQIKTTNINNNHLLWPSNACLEASDTAWIEMCFKIRIGTFEWCVWVFLSAARFIFILFCSPRSFHTEWNSGIEWIQWFDSNSKL